MSRPSEFTQETADRICLALMEGQSLRSVCTADDMPAVSTVFYWMQRNKEFSEQYARAREIQAEILADELQCIADDGSEDWETRTREDGTEYDVVNHEHINRSRLRIDTRKWILSKLIPKKYGEKLTQEISGPDGGAIPVSLEIDL